MRPYRGKTKGAPTQYGPIEKNEWVYGWYFYSEYLKKGYIIGEPITIFGWCLRVEVDPSTVGQNTGKKAAKSYRKDLEIYDGDKLVYRDILSDKWILDKNKTVGVVRWIDYKCGYYPQEIEENHKGGHCISFWDSIEDIEIIGTIHKEKKDASS